jgi:hypothetical protein
MNKLSVRSALLFALFLSLFFLLPAPGSAAQSSAPGAAANAPPSPSISPSFETLRVIPAANAPAHCDTSAYGSLAARAPDGALCLCHQSYDGKQGIWEQLGAGKACWPDQK